MVSSELQCHIAKEASAIERPLYSTQDAHVRGTISAGETCGGEERIVSVGIVLVTLGLGQEESDTNHNPINHRQFLLWLSNIASKTVGLYGLTRLSKWDHLCTSGDIKASLLHVGRH